MSSEETTETNTQTHWSPIMSSEETTETTETTIITCENLAEAARTIARTHVHTGSKIVGWAAEAWGEDYLYTVFIRDEEGRLMQSCSRLSASGIIEVGRTGEFRGDYGEVMEPVDQDGGRKPANELPPYAVPL